MKNIPLTVFLPAYNEEKNIRRAIEVTQSAIMEVTHNFEIIVVNDGSRDETGKIIDELAKTNPYLIPIHHKTNLGYGAALWSGLQNAKKEWFFFTDADLQFDVREISKLMDKIPQYKVVLGYRAKRKDSFMRILNTKGWHLLVRALFGLHVHDMDCAFKLFQTNLVSTLPLETRGATMSAEILIRLAKKGIVWTEVPVSHYPRTAGSPTGAKPKVIIRAFKELFSLYLKGI